MPGKRTKTKEVIKKKYKVEMTPLSVFLWGFCLFFLLAWIFVLGILVGRGFMPPGAVTAISELKGQISRLQVMINHNKPHRNSKAEQKTESDPKLAFYEKLSSKKDKAKKKWVPKKPPAAPKVDKEKKESAGLKLSPQEEKKVETVNLPAEPPRQLNGEDQFTVQLASLKDSEKAGKMVNRLVDRGYPAYYYGVDVKGETYYRVRCGRFKIRADAEKYAQKLAQDTGINGFVSRLE